MQSFTIFITWLKVPFMKKYYEVETKVLCVLEINVQGSSFLLCY